MARGRPGAYMRWVAMTYIRIWIAYGDYYFRQNTLETLPLAIQCYIVAAHVYGPAGEIDPQARPRPCRRPTLAARQVGRLQQRHGGTGAGVPVQQPDPAAGRDSSNGVVGLANIFGFATTLYFCIPDNPELTALRDLIDDRLFKIRHCQDIQGVTSGSCRCSNRPSNPACSCRPPPRDCSCPPCSPTSTPDAELPVRLPAAEGARAVRGTENPRRRFPVRQGESATRKRWPSCGPATKPASTPWS